MTTNASPASSSGPRQNWLKALGLTEAYRVLLRLGAVVWGLDGDGVLLRTHWQSQGNHLCLWNTILSCIMSPLGWPDVSMGQRGALFDVQAKEAAAVGGLSLSEDRVMPTWRPGSLEFWFSVPEPGGWDAT